MSRQRPHHPVNKIAVVVLWERAFYNPFWYPSTQGIKHGGFHLL